MLLEVGVAPERPPIGLGGAASAEKGYHYIPQRLSPRA